MEDMEVFSFIPATSITQVRSNSKPTMRARELVLQMCLVLSAIAINFVVAVHKLSSLHKVDVTLKQKSSTLSGPQQFLAGDMIARRSEGSRIRVD